LKWVARLQGLEAIEQGFLAGAVPDIFSGEGLKVRRDESLTKQRPDLVIIDRHV
jgi:hypothetical protein